MASSISEFSDHRLNLRVGLKRTVGMMATDKAALTATKKSKTVPSSTPTASETSLPTTPHPASNGVEDPSESKERKQSNPESQTHPSPDTGYDDAEPTQTPSDLRTLAEVLDGKGFLFRCTQNSWKWDLTLAPASGTPRFTLGNLQYDGWYANVITQHESHRGRKTILVDAVGEAAGLVERLDDFAVNRMKFLHSMQSISPSAQKRCFLSEQNVDGSEVPIADDDVSVCYNKLLTKNGDYRNIRISYFDGVPSPDSPFPTNFFTVGADKVLTAADSSVMTQGCKFSPELVIRNGYRLRFNRNPAVPEEATMPIKEFLKWGFTLFATTIVVHTDPESLRKPFKPRFRVAGVHKDGDL